MTSEESCLVCSRVLVRGVCWRCRTRNGPRLRLSFDGFRLCAEVLGLDEQPSSPAHDDGGEDE